MLTLLSILGAACTPPSPGAPAQMAAPEASTPTVTGEPTAPPPATAQVVTASVTSSLTTAATDAALPTGVSPAASGPSYAREVEARIGQVISGLVPAAIVANDEFYDQPFDLASRMAYYAVPGVSVAVIQNGQLEWARGFGVTDELDGYPVTPETLFQAASISKPVTTLGALTLVHDGQLELDEPFNPQLTSWRIPGDPPVTLRQTLAHTAGFNVAGFRGYTPDERLPSLLQILNGEAPANSPAIRAGEPGQYNYSGGGYVVVQQLIEDVTGQPFDAFMQTAVLNPLEMHASTFSQPLLMEFPGDRAAGHTFDRQPLPGGFNIYPELAPAGLWSTPSEIAQVLIEINAAVDGRGRLLTRDLALDLLAGVTPGRGMGLVLPGADTLPVADISAADSKPRMFGHGGSNQGYRTLMFGVAGRGQGAVVMTNSDNGLYLIFEIFRAIQQVYEWPPAPAWRAVERAPLTHIDADPSILPEYTGRYRLSRLTFAIVAEGERLYVQLPAGSGPKYRLYPTGPDVFTTLDQAIFTFHRDTSGAVSTLTTNAWGEQDLQASKER